MTRKKPKCSHCEGGWFVEALKDPVSASWYSGYESGGPVTVSMPCPLCRTEDAKRQILSSYVESCRLRSDITGLQIQLSNARGWANRFWAMPLWARRVVTWLWPVRDS